MMIFKDQRFLTAAECAAILRVSKRTFKARMRPDAPLARMGFPRPIRQPGAPFNARQIWAAADVDRWIAAQARIAHKTAADEDEDELIARAAAMAARA